MDLILLFFFFSSRRRHTRSTRDWSSDVCSSDLQELLVNGSQVTGVRGRAAGGPTVNETARIVIGADGMRSIIARSVQAEVYEAYPRLACYYYAYWSGMPADALELYPRPGLIVGVFPTRQDLA